MPATLEQSLHPSGSRPTAGSAPATSVNRYVRQCEDRGAAQEMISRGGKKFFPHEIEEMLPEELEVFTEFPFTRTGKIQRHALTRDVLARRAR